MTAPTPVPRPADRAAGRGDRRPESADVVTSGRRPRRGRGATIAYALLIGYALLMLVPFPWPVITSFKTNPDALRLTVIPTRSRSRAGRPASLTLDPSIPQLFLNSVIIAGAVTLTNLVLASMAGYAFARLRFPRPRAPVHRGPRDADDPGPAAVRAGLPDRQRRSA